MRKKLTKSNTNVMISGSLAGIAEYIGIDPTILRVIYVLLSLFTVGFPGMILYIALMVLMPSKTTYNYEQDKYSHPYGEYRYTGQKATQRPRKESEKVDSDDDWSDF